MYGTATSPIVHREMLILVLDDLANLPGSQLSRSRVIALKKSTGELVWETPRPFHRDSWSTPMIWKHQQGTDLVVHGNGRVCGYHPETGEEKWYASGFSREAISIPVTGNGLLYVSSSMQGGRGDEKLDPGPFWKALLYFDGNGNNQIEKSEISRYFTTPFRPELPPEHPGFGLPLPGDPTHRRRRQNAIFDWYDRNRDGIVTREEFQEHLSVGRGRPNLAAIQPGGKGDITDTHVSWNLRRGIPEIPSPLFHRDRIYLIRDGGILSCVDARTGKFLYQKRTGASGQYSASPVLANDYIYVISSRGVVTVVPAGDAFEIAHQEDLKSPVAATPAIDEDSLYIRTADGLMAFR